MKFRFLVFVLMVVFFSCKKEDEICYVCQTTYLVTTDQPVPNYPATTTTEQKFSCTVPEEQVLLFESTTKGSDVAVVGGITYSSSYATVCKKNGAK